MHLLIIPGTKIVYAFTISKFSFTCKDSMCMKKKPDSPENGIRLLRNFYYYLVIQFI